MALGENNNMGTTMLVSPAAAPMYYGNNGCGLGFGNDWGSLIILFLLFGMFGNGGFGYGGGFGGNSEFPWLFNGQNGINSNMNNGFQNAQLNDNVTSVRDGISALSTQVCNSTGTIQMGMSNGFNSVNTSINERDLDFVDKLSHSLKCIDTVCAMEGYDGYSGRTYHDNYSGRMYRDNYSYGNMGSRRGYSNLGRYSRDEAKDRLVNEMEGMMNEVSPEAQHAIQRAISALNME